LSIFRKQTTYLATLPRRSGNLLNSIMVSTNAHRPCDGDAGDVVLGRNGGGIFIPPQLAEQVVKGCL